MPVVVSTAVVGAAVAAAIVADAAIDVTDDFGAVGVHVGVIEGGCGVGNNFVFAHVSCAVVFVVASASVAATVVVGAKVAATGDASVILTANGGGAFVVASDRTRLTASATTTIMDNRPSIVDVGETISKAGVGGDATMDVREAISKAGVGDGGVAETR